MPTRAWVAGMQKLCRITVPGLEPVPHNDYAISYYDM
jgi:hypothetical protein